MTKSTVLAAAAAGCALSAGHASAGVDLLITYFPTAANEWLISAEFLGMPPASIDMIWADVGLRITGDAPINVTTYNPAYDTSLGNAVITDNNSTEVLFVGNANSFFGTPDASNPLGVLAFEYSGSFASLQLELVGQNSALFDDGSPFGLVELYQDALGNPGTLSFAIFPPAPGSAVALGLGGLIASRRRRGA